MQGKVSILTPVYNGESYVERYLKSIINQTYKNIELIIIDDGSTDKTKEIIQKYLTNNEGIEIKYIYQENGGQASAIANGIKFVSGDFLAWADSDDYYEEDAIFKMVDFFNKNDEADVIRCNAIARDENDLSGVLYPLNIPEKYAQKRDVFEDCIFTRGINCFPGVYMVRFEKYKANNPELYIYNGREGQNWQLLLPSFYNNKCYHLNESVYNYVIRNNSHSRMKRDVEKQIKRADGKAEIIKNTLKILNMDEAYMAELVEKIDEHFAKEKYFVYAIEGNKEKVKEYYSKLKEKNSKVRIAYFIGTIKPLNHLYRKVRGF